MYMNQWVFAKIIVLSLNLNISANYSLSLHLKSGI